MRKENNETAAKERFETGVAKAKKEYHLFLFQVLIFLIGAIAAIYLSGPNLEEPIYGIAYFGVIGIYFSAILYWKDYVRVPIDKLLTDIGLERDILDQVPQEMAQEWELIGCSKNRFRKEIRKVLH